MYYHYKAGRQKKKIKLDFNFPHVNVYRFPAMNKDFIHHIRPSISFSRLKQQAVLLHRQGKRKFFFGI